MQVYRFSISALLTHSLWFTLCSVRIIIYYGIPTGPWHNLSQNVTMPLNWEITKHRREGEEIATAWLRVPCNQRTFGRFLVLSLVQRSSKCPQKSSDQGRQCATNSCLALSSLKGSYHICKGVWDMCGIFPCILNHTRSATCMQALFMV
jgi:hypothetical protein